MRRRSRLGTRLRPASNCPQSVLDILGEPQFMEQNPINIDPPAHTPIRRAWGRALMRRHIKELEPILHGVADSLLDAMQSKGNRGDLMAEFASPFPASVVLCALLGVPREEVHRHVEWGHSVVLLLGGDAPVADLEAAAHSHVQHLEYWSNQLEDRRRSPRDDLLTAFVEECEAEPEIDLSPRALAYLPLGLSTAGHVTTAQSIAFGTKLLLEHPDQRRRGACGSGRDVRSCRRDSSIRVTRADAASNDGHQRRDWRCRHSRPVPMSLVVIGSANRDPSAYQGDPSTFDIRRTDAAQHLTFGRGSHLCLGAPLARREVAVALSTLFMQAPESSCCTKRCHATHPSLVPSRIRKIRGRVGVMIRQVGSTGTERTLVTLSTDTADGLDPMDLFRRMLRGRRFDERVLAHRQSIAGHFHVSMGLEAVAAAVTAALQPQDRLVTTYRNHALLAALGTELGDLLAEILGRGPRQHGRSGSTHLNDPQRGVLHTSALVAGGISHALGIATRPSARRAGRGVRMRIR